MAQHTFEWTSGNYGIRFIINQVNNPDANTSTITIYKMYVKAPGQSIILDGRLWINGTHVWTASMYQGTHVQWANGWTEETVGSFTTITVPHNADGSLTLTLTLKKNDYTKFFICNSSGSALVGWADGTAQSKTATANEVGKVRIYTSSGWVSATPYVYTSSGWTKAIPYVYTSSGWTKAK